MAKKIPAHYVYIYRNEKNEPVYVGQGKSPNRALQHLNASHNERFESWLNKNKEKPFAMPEIIGPLGDKNIADRIETAIISLLGNSLFNANGGKSEYRFRPFGVPVKYASRTLETLQKNDFKALVEKYGPIIFVKISGKNFKGRKGKERKGYDLISIPTDDEIRDRIIQHWMLNGRRLSENWGERPDKAPGLLIGVFGGPGRQLIIGSCKINKRKWGDENIPTKGGITIPVVSSKSIDEAKLRGKYINKDFGLKFAPRRAEFFQIFNGKGLPD